MSINNIVCQCHKCANKRYDKALLNGDYSAAMNEIYMRLCPICGNKRCPKASDHELNCTNSNEPGQEGSVYQ